MVDCVVLPLQGVGKDLGCVTESEGRKSDVVVGVDEEKAKSPPVKVPTQLTLNFFVGRRIVLYIWLCLKWVLLL